MPWDHEHGCNAGGTNGMANHHGEPLTVAEIRELPDGAEIVITWSGGNGPWPERVLVDRHGVRRTESLHCDPLLQPYDDQEIPLHRITLGWDDASRAWADGRIPEPVHIQEKWRWLRGEDIRCVHCGEPIRRAWPKQSSTGWTHDPGVSDRGWQGIRCPRMVCGATPPAAAPEGGEQVEFRTQPRQAGKTSAMYDEMLRVWRQFEERAVEERLILVCHPDDHDRARAALDAALARQPVQHRVTLLTSELAVKGSVAAFEQLHLPPHLRVQVPSEDGAASDEQRRFSASVGVSAIVRCRDGDVGMVVDQRPAGAHRYKVLFPGEPIPVYYRAEDLEVLQGIDLDGWWQRGSTQHPERRGR